MKKRYHILLTAVCFCLSLLTVVLIGVSASAESEKSKADSKWETQKSITISSNGVKYYAYLSKDKKESWIYEIDPVKKVKKLLIPKKIKTASVTRIGFGAELYADGSDYFVSVFGDSLEPWHDLYGTHLKKKNAITEIVFPKTVKDIEMGAFSGMKRLEKVHIPDKVKTIPRYSFSACDSLKEVKFPKNLREIDTNAFAVSFQIKSLSISKGAKKYTVDNDILIDKTKKCMVWVASGKKNVTIPDRVTSIADYAFQASRAKTVHIPKSIKDIGKEALTAKKIRNVSLDGANPVYAMKNHCIYTKKDGTLVAVLVKGLKIQIPNSVKIMGENVSVMGKLEADDDEIDDDEKRFSVHIPSSVKKVIERWMFFDLSVEVYFHGKKPPKIESKYSGSEYTALPINNSVYVPKGTKKTYIKWAKDRDGLTWEDLHVFAE